MEMQSQLKRVDSEFIDASFDDYTIEGSQLVVEGMTWLGYRVI